MKRLPGPYGQNNLIATLSEADRDLLLSGMTPVALEVRMVLEPRDEIIENVYFPVSGLGSMIAENANGRRVEAGLFGREGMSGTTVLVGGDRPTNETVIQMAGHAQMIAADHLRQMMEDRPSLRRHLLQFVQTMLSQTSQTALSNAQAKLEERLARWLLMCHDRIDGDRMTLTHEFLSVMLGVRRAGVTVGIHMLEGKGLIRASRGSIEVLDRAGLEAEAQQSCGVPEAEYRRLYG